MMLAAFASDTRAIVLVKIEDRVDDEELVDAVSVKSQSRSSPPRSRR
jgi:hypothetical protein